VLPSLAGGEHFLEKKIIKYKKEGKELKKKV